VTEKTVKVKQPEKPKQIQKAQRPSDKDREKSKQPNRLVRWWRETVGELRKVSWPTLQETRRLTGIVLIVMFLMSAVLGLLDWVFSKVISLLVS
jgi:preprotein translocase subunit SecE